MLHIVKHTCALPQALALALPGDTLLLLEDAVYAVLPGHKAHQAVLEAGLPVYVLQEDLAARGLAELDSPIEQVDFAGFVDLTAEDASSITW